MAYGHYVSKRTVQTVPWNLIEESGFDKACIDEVEQALLAAFQKSQADLVRYAVENKEDVAESGSTALAVLFERQQNLDTEHWRLPMHGWFRGNAFDVNATGDLVKTHLCLHLQFLPFLQVSKNVVVFIGSDGIWDFIASAESMNSQMPSVCFKTDKGWDGGDSERVAIGPRFVACTAMISCLCWYNSTSMAGCPRNGPAWQDFSCFFHVFHMRVDWIPHIGNFAMRVQLS